MATSRLRLQLAGGFALAFAISLAILAAGALGYLWRESNRRLDARLDIVAANVASAIMRETKDAPDSSLRFAARQVVEEWPPNGDAFVILDSTADTLAIEDPERHGRSRRPHGSGATRAVEAWRKRPAQHLDLDVGGPDFRVTALQTSVGSDDAHMHLITVLAFASTEGIESDTEQLGVSLAIAAPLICLLSLSAGYLLARGALAPVTKLTAEISSMSPTDLSRRLPIEKRQDELSALAVEFNALLSRLEEAQQRNRGFVREAAHQIRTPLTLVLGEAAHELSAVEANAPRMRATLARIRTAAEQMRRRVDELFLLAEARTGEPLRLEDTVELDGLVLECADLMRSRATSLGRALAISVAEPLVVRGNAALLQEAVLELLENACRHGATATPVTIACRLAGPFALIEVTSGGEAFALPLESDATHRSASGLGLSIVRWVAESHGGSLLLSVDHERGVHVPTNRMTMRIRVNSPVDV